MTHSKCSHSSLNVLQLTQSDAQQVRIVNLHRRLSGEYQCEVSADAPLFHTDIRAAPLTVVGEASYGLRPSRFGHITIHISKLA